MGQTTKLNLYTLRRQQGKCVQCGKEKETLAVRCDKCLEIGRRGQWLRKKRERGKIHG